MKTAIIGMGLALLVAGSVQAAPAPSVPPAPQVSPPTCVDVQIGEDRTPYLNCLNQAFERDVAREHATPKPEAPIDARSSATQTGTANETAARQRMGNAFGVSPAPQKPERVFV